MPTQKSDQSYLSFLRKETKNWFKKVTFVSNYGFDPVESDPGPQACQQAPQHIPQQQFLPPGADNVGREDSACQKQFNPGDETYRCIDCELTDDTPGIEFFLFPTENIVTGPNVLAVDCSIV